MYYLLQCSIIARQLSSSVLDGGAVFIFLGISLLFSAAEGVGYPGGADYGLVALLSISAIVATCAVYASEGLDDMRARGRTGLRPALTQGLVGAAAGALIAIPLSSAYSIFSRAQGGITPGLAQISIALVPISVFFSQFLQRCMRQYAHTQRRIVVVGDRTIAGRIAGQREIAHEVVGFFELDPHDPLADGENPGTSEVASRLAQFLRQAKPDEVVVACADRQGTGAHATGLPVWDLLQAKANGLRVVDFADFWERETGRIDLQSLHPAWLLFGPALSGNARFLLTKRVGDAVFASLMLLLTSWVFCLVAALVKTTSQGPAIYRQERVGLNGRTFTLLKFRSMHVDAEQGSGPTWARPNDPRVTPVGAFLRKTRLDELPQLWNILRGDMSLVGPRPERVHFVELLSRTLPFYGLRHAMKPGLTGWAQVNNGYAASVDESAEKLSYDLFYIRHGSILFDLFIAARTLRVVLKRTGQ